MVDRAGAYWRHQQARWLRADAARWVRPDAAKFLKPGTRLEDVYPALATKYNENQPRVPAGNGRESGRWGEGGGSGRPRVHIYRSDPDSTEVGDSGSDTNTSIATGIDDAFSAALSDIAREIGKLDLFDIKPRARSGGVRLAGDLPDGFRAPDDEPPKVPKTKPQKSSQRTGFYRAVTSFARRYPTIAGDIVIGIIKNIDWLEDIADMLHADLDPPKTLAELQADVGARRPGYDVHHIIEQTAAERYGLTRSEIDDPSNLVSIPRLKHYQITGWYGAKNDDYDGLSPRDYLLDKCVEERRSVGLHALVKFQVLKP